MNSNSFKFTRDKEMSGARRLFYSPPKYSKTSFVASTKGGTKIYQNKLEEIMEEDNN